MQTQKVIPKNLDDEAIINEHISYYPMAGASKQENFRSPDAYVFLLFEKAEGIHTIDFVDYEEGDNQIHISFPEQIHSWNTKEGAKGHKLIVSKSFMEKFMSDAFHLNYRTNKQPVLKIKKRNLNLLCDDIKALAIELSERTINWQLVNLRARVVLLIINKLLDKKAPKAEKMTKGNIITVANNFKLLLETHIRENRSVSFYSTQLMVSANYLGIICSRVFGINAKTVINQRLTLEAKRLLLGTNNSVKEIAFELGFTDLANFSTFMKIQTGISPSDFRKENSDEPACLEVDLLRYSPTTS